MKKRLFSGIQPSGELHIGNYLGAIENWVKYQDEYDCIYSIVDYHALTVPYAIEDMPGRVQDLAAMLLACGLDPERAVLFQQSDVIEHAALSWIFSCVTPINYLERMIQYKEKSQQHGVPNTGLFSYPILQSADILLYLGEAVPVGEDQLQHLELARDIARKFNMRVEKDFFPEPQPVLSPARRILGLDGKNKMSKSLNNHIAMADDEAAIQKKLRGAVTDVRRVRLKDPGEPKDCNVFSLHQFFSTEAETEEIAGACRTAQIGCSDCKKRLACNMAAKLEPIQERYHRLKANPDEVDAVLESGAQKAKAIAAETLEKTHRLLGFKA